MLKILSWLSGIPTETRVRIVIKTTLNNHLNTTATMVMSKYVFLLTLSVLRTFECFLNVLCSANPLVFERILEKIGTKGCDLEKTCLIITDKVVDAHLKK